MRANVLAKGLYQVTQRFYSHITGSILSFHVALSQRSICLDFFFSPLPYLIVVVMSSGDDYKEWQDRYDELNNEAWENNDREDDDPDKWDATGDRDHTENMRDTTEQ